MARADLAVLVLCDFDGQNANVVRDYLYSFHAYSRHRVYYFHDCRRLDAGFDFSGFDVIVLFWGCDWFWDVPIDPGVADGISRSRALKVLFLQDEYRTVRRNNALAARLGVQLVFSCADEKDFDFFYPRAAIPTLQAVYPALTGYVPYYLERPMPGAWEARPIDIGYRSRIMPFHLGDLAREKVVIAERFLRIAREHGFRADVSVNELDRLYGRRWLEFLRSCKFTLGSGSGASVIDLDGTVQARCAAYRRAHPAAGYDEVRERFFADLDGRVVIDTVSPRVFEAVAYGNVLVLHEGPYGGLVRPDEHYIAVKKDYSNIAGVVERMRDRGYCARLRAAAYRDLIASGRYSYRAFVRYFDERVEAHAPAPAAVPAAGAPAAGARPPSKARFYLANYVRRGQGIIPRGTRFVRIPRPTFRAVAAVVARAPCLVPWSLLVLTALWDLPSLRRALWHHLLRPWQWPRLAGRAVWREVYRLGVLRCPRGRGLLRDLPFQLEPQWRDADGACCLVARPLAPGIEPADLAPAELPAEIAAAGPQECRRLVWDHAAVGPCALVRLGRGRPHRVGVGVAGVSGDYRFGAVGALCATAGVRPAALMQDVLAPRPCALQVSWGLRLVAALALLPSNLATRWRDARSGRRPAPVPSAGQRRDAA